MGRKQDQLDKLALALSESQQVNWDQALGESTDVQESRLIRNLKLISAVGEAHRRAMAEARGKDLPFPRWGHLELIDMIGEGSYGQVFRARDHTLGRDVALKLFPKDDSRDPARAATLLDEARRLARIRHENVVRVHGAEVHHGRLGFWMELVPGLALDQVLEQEGPLSEKQAAEVGLAVARALAAVHDANLLHRDIKASNVVRGDDGRIYLVDFGAGINSEEGEGRHLHLVGTPYYMAPELFRGAPSSVRSDIHSLGVLLFHLVSKRYPVEADTLEALRVRHEMGARKELAEVAPGISARFQTLVERCLDPDPERRFASAAEVAEALEQLARPRTRVLRNPLAWIGTALVLAIIVLGVVSRRPTEAPGLAHTLLILPMEVYGQTQGAEYLGRAFSEAIAINLSQVKDARVLPVTDHALPTSGPAPQLQRAALRAGAGRVVRGSLVRKGPVIQANLTLLDATKNQIMWGKQSEFDQEDLSRFAGEMAKEITAQLGLTMAKHYEYFRYVAGSAAMASSPLLSEAIGANRRHDVATALGVTKRLLDVYPNEPEAYVLRIVALTDAGNSNDTAETRKAMQESLDHLELVDPHHPLVALIRADGKSTVEHEHDEAIKILTNLLSRTDLTPGFLSHVLRTRARAENGKGNFAAASADLEDAVRLDPGNPWTYGYHAMILAARGQIDAAVQRARQSMALDPSAQSAALLATVLMQSGEYEEAVSWARRAKELDPTGLVVCLTVGYALSGVGKHEEALTVLRAACDQTPMRVSCFAVATQLEYLGRHSEAREAAKKAASLPPTLPMDDPRENEACYLAVAGDRRGAIRILKQIRDARGLGAAIFTDPDLASLHGDPEYEGIVAEFKRRTGK